MRDSRIKNVEERAVRVRVKGRVRECTGPENGQS